MIPVHCAWRVDTFESLLHPVPPESGVVSSDVVATRRNRKHASSHVLLLLGTSISAKPISSHVKINVKIQIKMGTKRRAVNSDSSTLLTCATCSAHGTALYGTTNLFQVATTPSPCTSTTPRPNQRSEWGVAQKRRGVSTRQLYRSLMPVGQVKPTERGRVLPWRSDPPVPRLFTGTTVVLGAGVGATLGSVNGMVQ